MIRGGLFFWGLVYGRGLKAFRFLDFIGKLMGATRHADRANEADRVYSGRSNNRKTNALRAIHGLDGWNGFRSDCLHAAAGYPMCLG
jgi:hypothetical protein